MTRKQLDRLATIYGTIAGLATLLATQQWIEPRLGLTIAGIAQIALGIVSNKPSDYEVNR